MVVRACGCWSRTPAPRALYLLLEHDPDPVSVPVVATQSESQARASCCPARSHPHPPNAPAPLVSYQSRPTHCAEHHRANERHGEAPRRPRPRRRCRAVPPRRRPGRRRAAAVRGGRGAGGVRRRAGGVGVRRGGAAGVRGGGVPLHPGGADVPGARPPRQVVPALAVAAPRLLAPQLQRDGDAGDAAREADAVRGRLAEPGAVRVAALPPPPRHAGGLQLLRDRRRPQRLPGQGLRRHHRVLLGAAPRRVQLRRRRRAPAQRPPHPRRAHGPPLPLLEGRRRPRLQLLPLVDDRRQDPDPEGCRQRHEQGHRGDGGGGGLQAGAAPGGAVAGRQRGPEEIQGLLRHGVADARQRPALGQRGGGQQLPRPDGAHRRRVLLGEHEQGDAAGDRRGAGRVGEGARRRGERHADVRVPPGRAHAGVQGAVGAADQGAARRPQELRRLHPLVPPRRARRMERAALLEALLPRQRPGALTVVVVVLLTCIVQCRCKRRAASCGRHGYNSFPFFGNVIKCVFPALLTGSCPLHVGCVPWARVTCIGHANAEM